MRAVVAVIVSAVVLAGVAPAAGSTTSSRWELAYWRSASLAAAPKVWLARGGGGARELGIATSTFVSPDGALVAGAPWAFASPAVTMFSAGGAVKGRFLDPTKSTGYVAGWSADSRYLAVVITSGADRADRPGLLVIDTVTHRIARIADGGILGASFAPDRSDRIVYARAAGLNFSPPTNLYTATADGRSVRQLTHDYFSATPAWGSRGIAYTHASGPHPATSINQVWMVRPDGTRRRQLTNLKQRGLAHGLQPFQFSADGEHLLADYSGRRGRSQTWTIDINTRRTRRIRLGGQDVTPDGISKDGTRLLVELPTRGLNAMIESIGWAGDKATFLAHGNGASWNR